MRRAWPMRGEQMADIQIVLDGVQRPRGGDDIS
jgi:hypothetical protein